jgi:hypothetical protein
MNFSNREHTQEVWKTIEEYWRDSKKNIGNRFIGNNLVGRKSVEDILDTLAEDLSSVGTVSIEKLNARWGDRQNRNWVKIITFVLSEYAYYNDADGGFWQSVFQRLQISDAQGTKQTFWKILKEGFDLLDIARAKGGTAYLSTLYLQSGIPQQNLKYFADLVEDIADNLGWWNIAHRYQAIDLAQTLYDRALEKHSQRPILKRFLKSSCPDNESGTEPLSGNILKYIATVALELERRSLNPQSLINEQTRAQYLQGFNLPYNFFLRDWNNLVSVLTPKKASQKIANKIIRQRKRELLLRLDTLELNLQLVLPEQLLWRKEWRTLSGNNCKIPQANWDDTIPYPDSLAIPELCVSLKVLVDHWIWQLKDSNNQDLLEWHCEGIRSNFPLLIFDAATGDRIVVNPEDSKIVGFSEVICYFPNDVKIQLSKAIEVIDSCFPCLISGWQAKQIRLAERSTSFSMTSDNISIILQWQAANNNQPLLRGLQLKGKYPTYLEAPQIYYPLGNSIKSLLIQIEDMDRQFTVTPPDTKITLRITDESWQKIALDEWIKSTGSYEVKLWHGNWSWSTAFIVKSNFQSPLNSNLSAIQIWNSKQEDISLLLPMHFSKKSQFWLEEIKIKGLWAFEPVIFLLSNGIDHDTFSYSIQANQVGCLNLSLMSLREALPDGDRYSLEWVRFGNSQTLIEQY